MTNYYIDLLSDKYKLNDEGYLEVNDYETITKWLDKFSDLWDKDCDNGERHMNLLTDAYTNFLAKYNLPSMCALELRFMLASK